MSSSKDRGSTAIVPRPVWSPMWKRVTSTGGIAVWQAARESDAAKIQAHRSEEHTSELQSLMRISYAVFCLKKKKKTIQRNKKINIRETQNKVKQTKNDDETIHKTNHDLENIQVMK